MKSEILVSHSTPPRVPLLLAALFATSSAASSPPFEAWARAHGRDYASPAAASAARAAFAANAARVAAHELERAAGRATHSLALNGFADMAPSEFAAAVGLGGVGSPAASASGLRGGVGVVSDTDLPESVDWLARGFVPPVWNSGSCASGGTLAFTDSVSAAGGILAGKLSVLYDPAQIGTCDGCGCTGCLASAPWTWALKHGVTSNYSASCAYTPTLRVTHENRVQPRNDSALAEALVAGPTLVVSSADAHVRKRGAFTHARSLTAPLPRPSRPPSRPRSPLQAIDLQALQLYSGGIVTSACAPTVDSVVLAVAYAPEYFKIKNSWGAAWGEKGFARIGRGAKAPADGVCGILTSAAWPTVEEA